jgi:putative ubiquitin-RnfH superfamily antitoxin RatB of RatAB toxin-antitoxin module
MKVTVAFAAPGIEVVEPVDLPDGATLGDAVERSGLLARLASPATPSFASHGQRARADTPLADGDRVEILRPLVADAKAIRRARAAHHPLPRGRKVTRPPGT